MKKNFTLKSLLLSACLMLGMGAWAQTTVEWQCIERISTDDSGTYTTSDRAGNKYALAIADLSEVDGIASAGTVTINFITTINSGTRWLIGIGDKATRGTTAGESSKAVYTTEGLLMRFGTSDGNYFRVNGGTNNTDAFGVPLNVEVTLDRDHGTYSYTISNVIDETVYFQASDLEAPVANANIVEAYSWANNTSIDLDPVSVTITASVEEHATYTVLYKDANDNEIKESEERDGIVGSTPMLLASDKDPIRIDNIKYVYDYDDAADQEIASDGSTEVTVWFTVADTYTAALNFVDEYENVIVESYGETQAFEGDQVTIYYPHYIFDGSTYLVTERNAAEPYYGKKFTEAGTQDVAYTTSDIAYFTEVENMTYTHRWAADGGVVGRYSSGRAVRLYKDSYCYTEPITEGGTYTLTLWARNQSGSQTASLPIFLRKASSGDLFDLGLTIGEWSPAGFGEMTVEGVEIPEGFQLVLNNNTEWNSNLELDYLTLVKTGENATFPIPTAIQEVKESTADGIYYNLQGQRVSQPRHGIFVNNGKKVIVK